MMNWITLSFSLILLTMIIPTKAISAIGCTKSTRDCIRSSDCCTGCCDNNKCVEYSEACLSDLEKFGGGHGGLCNPPCTKGKICKLQQVQCFRAPCPPITNCVPEDYDDYDN